MVKQMEEFSKLVNDRPGINMDDLFRLLIDVGRDVSEIKESLKVLDVIIKVIAEEGK